MLNVLSLVNVLACGIAAGGLLLVWIAFVPTRAALGPARGVELHQLATPLIDRLLPPAAALAGVAGIALALAGPHDSAALIPRAIGLAGIAVVAVLSLGLNMPANRRIATWRPDGVSRDQFEAAFGDWNRVHVARTLAGVTAFAAFAASALAA
jgi:hypothetical protein